MDTKRTNFLHQCRKGFIRFRSQLGKVFRNPVFISLTVIGNSALIVCAVLFFWVEKDVNPSVNDLGDALWWAFVTITTVGYGDVVPVSAPGRFLAVLLILTSGVLFLSFIALLSTALVEREVLELEKEIKSLKEKVEQIVKSANE